MPRNDRGLTDMVAKIMLKSGYEEGKGLGTGLQGIVEPISIAKREGHFGLGYDGDVLMDGRLRMRYMLQDQRFDQRVIPHIEDIFTHPLPVIQEVREEVEEFVSEISINVLQPSRVPEVLIMPMEEGQELDNWEAEDIPVLFLK